MITQLKGKLVEKTPTYIVVDCNGVGYQVNISLNTYSNLPDEENCLIYTHLVIREDAHVLYGFKDKEERSIFLNLISVSGVGANTALLILSSMTPDDVRNAILNADVATLQSIKGIGAKSAQRIIVDLKDKIGKTSADESKIFNAPNNTIKDEALSALVMLGYSKQQAEKALTKVLKSEQIDSVELLIKTVLKVL